MIRVMMLLLVVLPLTGCSETVRFSVKVTDEEGCPVTNAVVKIETLKRPVFGMESDPNNLRAIIAHAKSNGVVSVKFDSLTEHFIYWLTAEGYYRCPFREVRYELKEDHLYYVTLAEHEKEDSVVMRKVKNPIPMYSFRTYSGVRLPKENGDYGFDMKAGELVAPFGKGKVADFYVRKNFTEATPSAHRGTKAALFFVGRGNGAYKVKAVTDSEFRSPYAADTNAVFKTEFRYEFPADALCTWDSEVCDVGEDECLVLRTRCQYDAEGRLVSCHYSKLYGKLEIYSYLRFLAYAFNPTPNDTNLEFDVEKNLLDKDTSPYLP